MDFRTKTNHRPLSVLMNVLWGWAGDVSKCDRGRTAMDAEHLHVPVISRGEIQWHIHPGDHGSTDQSTVSSTRTLGVVLTHLRDITKARATLGPEQRQKAPSVSTISERLPPTLTG